jgi:cellulose synthase (UDP-forming)
VKGISPFARPLYVHIAIFMATLLLVVVQRKYFTPEARMALTSSEIWGMVAFAIIAVLMALSGSYAAVQSKNIEIEEPWLGVDLSVLKTQDKQPEQNKP